MKHDRCRPYLTNAFTLSRIVGGRIAIAQSNTVVAKTFPLCSFPNHCCCVLRAKLYGIFSG